MFSAKVICDSISPQGHRLTTMELRYPKFIHGEFMTHRVFSRNASSSRAIPTAKYLEEVREYAHRAQPIFWGKNQKGMQAHEELDPVKKEEARNAWGVAALTAAQMAENLDKLGAHKQIVNRLLEPFIHINVVVTATEWMNFFGLRLHPDAQPEMRALAQAMWAAYNDSEPRRLESGEWHLPYVNLDIDSREAAEPHQTLLIEDALKRISVARCARVSYRSHETGKRSTVEEDLKLFERLKASGHWSPFEHQATPDKWLPSTDDGQWAEIEQHGNFTGWRQYRKMLPGEACAPMPWKETVSQPPTTKAKRVISSLK